MPTFNNGQEITPPSGSDVFNLTIDQDINLVENRATNTTIPFYGSVEGGDEYFLQVLRSDAWFEATSQQKQQSLYEATEAIDKLNYRGDKTEETQVLQFPRGGDTDVPYDILFAAYNIALKLLEGFDPDLEIKQTLYTQQKFGPTESEYNPGRRTPLHLLVGIPSIKAWHKLLPYLREPESITVQRVS